MARNGHIPGPLVLKTKTLSAFFMEVFPEMAQDWLDNHNHINRRKRLATVDKYLRDKINSLWMVTHEAIAFDWNGELVDGQHRLEMCIQSGEPFKVLVVLGLDPQVRMVVDIGVPRRPADILKLLGYEANHLDVAIVRQMMNGFNRRATMTEIVKAYDKFEKKAKTVMEMFPNKLKGITKAPILAPMARSLETWPELAVKNFAELLYDGMGRKGNAVDKG